MSEAKFPNFHPAVKKRKTFKTHGRRSPQEWIFCHCRRMRCNVLVAMGSSYDETNSGKGKSTIKNRKVRGWSPLSILTFHAFIGTNSPSSLRHDDAILGVLVLAMFNRWNGMWSKKMVSLKGTYVGTGTEYFLLQKS